MSRGTFLNQTERPTGPGAELGRLLLNTKHKSYFPGQLFVFGLVNNILATVFYWEEPYFVQRWSGSAWLGYPLTLEGEEPWYPYRLTLPPGVRRDASIFCCRRLRSRAGTGLSCR